MAEVVIILLVSTLVFAIVARKLKVPEAIVLVLAGVAIGLVPGLPRIELDPDYVFVIVLPPLLHAQASVTSWKEFKDHLHGISALAVGLTLFTTVVVALATHLLVPGIPLPCAFVLGAIVSPPDAVSASAVARALRLPRRIVTVLEGESLVNDATGLVAYRFAVAAVMTGAFSLWGAGGNFVLMAAGGIVMGLVLGWVVTRLFEVLRDDTIVIALSVAAPYVTWYLAEQLHLSPVLAAVTGGIVIGARSPHALSANARLQGSGFWNTLVFLLNGVVFTLIGLQLPRIIANSHGGEWTRLVRDGAIVFAATVVARLVWIFPAAYLPGFLFPGKRRRHVRHPPWKNMVILSWAGMRGVVSLAAALALPLELADGQPFPVRDRLIFLAFCVVLGTLVVQGLTLPWVIRRLGIQGKVHDEEEEERAARLAAAHAALTYVRVLQKSGLFFATSARVVAAEYEDRICEIHHAQRVSEQEKEDHAAAEEAGDEDSLMHIHGSAALRRVALDAEHDALVELHQQRELGKELLLKLEREIDMAESRLPVTRMPATFVKRSGAKLVEPSATKRRAPAAKSRAARTADGSLVGATRR